MFTKSIVYGLLAALLLIASMGVVSAQEATPIPNPNAAEDTAQDIVDLTVASAESAATTLEAFINRLTTTPRSDVVRVLMFIGGVVLLVMGWRVYDYIVLIAGFVIGAMVGGSLFTIDNTLMTLAAILIGGIIGAGISYFLYYGAVFLIGAYIGIALTNALAISLSLTPVSAVALLLGGLIGGVVLVGLSFEFLILLSALVGAQLLTLSLSLTPIWTLAFTLAGIVMQVGLIRSFGYDFRRTRNTRRRNLIPSKHAL